MKKQNKTLQKTEEIIKEKNIEMQNNLKKLQRKIHIGGLLKTSNSVVTMLKSGEIEIAEPIIFLKDLDKELNKLINKK